MKTLSFLAARHLPLALFLAFLLSLPSSSALAGEARMQPSDENDESDVWQLTLLSEIERPSREQTRRLLSGICRPAHVRTVKDGSLYCDTVPGYPDEESCVLKIEGVTRGHFTSPQAVEAVADYQGCEAHVHDYGGSVLLRQEKGSWRRIAYFPGHRSARCLTFPRGDGRDALVCVGAGSGQGESGTLIELLSLKSEKERPDRLIDFDYLEGIGCGPFEVGERQSYSRLKSWERRPASGETPTRLVLQVEREDFLTPEFCGKPEDSRDLDELSSEVLYDRFKAFRAKHRRVETLTFDWTGERFVKELP